MDDKSYRERVMEWRREREHSLRRENGWLALAGLFWLEQGKNRAGSDSGCEVVLPARAPSTAGYFDLNGDTVTWSPCDATAALVSGQIVSPAVLQDDTAADPSFISFDDLRMVLIRRGDRLGVRLWDNQRPERQSRPPRSWYEVSPSFRVAAEYVSYATPFLSVMPDALGGEPEVPINVCIGFEFAGRAYKLDATREDDGEVFLRFRDQTAAADTYPSGRYLAAGLQMQSEGVLDFNYAYNPPCAFTPFATCLFAPAQNRLGFRVEAGELYPRT